MELGEGMGLRRQCQILQQRLEHVEAVVCGYPQLQRRALDACWLLGASDDGFGRCSSGHPAVLLDLIVRPDTRVSVRASGRSLVVEPLLAPAAVVAGPPTAKDLAGSPPLGKPLLVIVAVALVQRRGVLGEGEVRVDVENQRDTFVLGAGPPEGAR